MVTVESILKDINTLFGDVSVSQSVTKEQLEAIIDECEGLKDSLTEIDEE